MELGRAHSLSRYKLKFSPDKIETIIVQAVSLLDDMDKKLNNYVMRCREWYEWHVTELRKIITNNLAFVKTVELMGVRENDKNEINENVENILQKTLYEAREKKGFTVLKETVSKTLEQVMERVF